MPGGRLWVVDRVVGDGEPVLGRIRPEQAAVRPVLERLRDVEGIEARFSDRHIALSVFAFDHDMIVTLPPVQPGRAQLARLPRPPLPRWSAGNGCCGLPVVTRQASASGAGGFGLARRKSRNGKSLSGRSGRKCR